MLKRKSTVLGIIQKNSKYLSIVERYKIYQFNKKVNDKEYCNRATEKHSRGVSSLHNDWSKLFD
ncbi:hypothetical protein [Vagococcus xieshaowenii]|uniref:Transposase n=1 Tax=Vagococcus xieshaowenii TaxID=2562451 RepID=A0ABX5TFE4_9ENTE|nr:hypothetical protein [Vagococcus xieshaowenii]QCA28886.1 hypothetical protein E4Z98_05970 [Vagococcus xieshaowenii]